jgi:photosystem II oxygen-evolving enhancer protein 2
MTALRRGLLVMALGLLVMLGGCASVGLASLQRYSDTQDGYEFLYPNGWVGVDVKEASPGVDVVFRDLIEQSENLSVIVSEIPADKSLAELGDPSAVGYRFLRKINDDPDNGRQAELLSADERESDGKIYYLLEYRVTLPDAQQRHDLASVTTNRGKLVTFNLSTNERRWSTVEPLFKTVARSFSVY